MTEPVAERVRQTLLEIEKSENLELRCHPLLGKLRAELFGNEEVPVCELRWELIASNLYLADQPTHWGTYFGPVTSELDESGTRVDYPPLDIITEECVSYWEGRIENCTQPALRARYAHLTWEFSKKVRGRASIQAVHAAIDSYLVAVVQRRIDPQVRRIQAIRHILRLAVSIRDDARLNQACDILASHSTKPYDDPECVCQEHDLFPLLLQIPKKKWPLDTLKLIAGRIRLRFKNIPLQKGAQWSTLSLGVPLVEYYWAMQDHGEAQDVLRLHGEAVIAEAKDATAMMAIGWLEQLLRLYQKYEMHADVRTVMALMEQRQPDLPAELKVVKVPIQTSQKEMEEFVESVIKESLEASIVSIVRCFSPRLDEIRRQIKEIDETFPLHGFLAKSTSIVDRDGRTVAKVNDDEGKLISYLSRQLSAIDMHVQFVFKELLSRFTSNPKVLFEAIAKSPIWHRDRLPILERGIQAFVEEDSIAACHLLIPEIECAVRNLANELGVGMQKVHRNGGYLLKNLEDLLREEQVVSTMTEDLVYYFRAVLTDQRGWNIRNNVCHGIATANGLGMAAARRLVLMVFHLSLFHKQEPTV